MKQIIEEITFVVNGNKNTYKLYKYEEIAVRKIGTLNNYEDTKVKITKYALHQEFEMDETYHEQLVCETETYATILTIFKDILTTYIKLIEKHQFPIK